MIYNPYSTIVIVCSCLDDGEVLFEHCHSGLVFSNMETGVGDGRGNMYEHSLEM